MTTREALLKAVLAAPDDDLPRLVFADHFEENGEEERAEFIRVQIEYAKIPVTLFECADGEVEAPTRQADAARYSALKAREKALFTTTNVAKWFGDLTLYPAPPNVKFRRGFVDAVEWALGWWMRHGPAVVRDHPVAKVVLTDKEPWEQESASGLRFRWSDAGNPNPLPSQRFNPQSELPTDVLHWLNGFLFAPGNSPHHKWYATREIAISALSTALIQWAKSQPV